MSVAVGMAVGINLGDDSVELKRAGDTNDALDRRLGLVEGNNIDLRAEVTDLEVELGRVEGVNASLSGRNTRLQQRLETAQGRLQNQQATQAASPPSSGDIDVGYGEWAGLFTMNSLSLGQDFDNTPKLAGTITYNGGGDCDLGYIEVEALFYSGSTLLATGYTNFTSLPQGTPRALDITTYDAEGAATSAEVTVVEANCD
jgi:hypothetical protein